MKHIMFLSKLNLLALASILILSGCIQALVKDETRHAKDGSLP
jgi:hypothetical protein